MVRICNKNREFYLDEDSYRIEDCVRVCKGMVNAYEHPVIINIIESDEDKLEDHVLERFRREIEILFRVNVNRDNLLKTITVFPINEANAPKGAVHGFYVVNEYLEGVSLSDVIRGAVTNEFARQISDQYKTDPCYFANYIIKNVLCGMMKLHDNDISLRELDPSRILITQNKEVKIDWCTTIMKRFFSYNNEYESNPYLAPELFTYAGVDKQTADVYATGILYFQLLTGHLPFDNSLKSNLDRDVPLKDIANWKIRKIINRATEKDPNKRFRNAREFLEAIDNLEKPNHHLSIESLFSYFSKAVSCFRMNAKEKDDSINISEIINTHSNTQKKDSSYCRTYKISSSNLKILFGNILESNAEVIVSSDDNTLSMSGGVSEAIASMGGNMIRNDAKKIIPVQLGDMVVTTAGELPQKYIFHCATIDYKNEIKRETDVKGFQKYIICRSVDKCLRMMPLLGVKSIAFPTLGAGVAKFSLEEIAIYMTDVITDFLYSTNKQYYIEICLYDRLKQKNVMDYMAFFENIAINISRKNDINAKKVETNIEENIEMEERRILPMGALAATSPQDEHKVFVSYSRKDIDSARVFCNLMDELGISYWIDVDGKYSGTNFKEVLVDAIDASQMMVFFSSINSNQSPFVIKEIGLAVAGKKKILPIKLDDSPYAKSIRFDLGDIDWIEFTKENQSVAFDKFKHSLQLYLKR